jgi:excisionase family DNA binding protein
MPTELLTPEQAAEHLGLKVQTLAVWRSTRRYALRYVKVGRLVRYRKADLDGWLAARTISTAGGAGEAAAETTP